MSKQSRRKIALAKKATLLLTVMLLLSPTVFARSYKWRQMAPAAAQKARSGQFLMAAPDYYTALWAIEATKKHPPENDPLAYKMMNVDIPYTLEGLLLNPNGSLAAKNLAGGRMGVSKRMWGTDCETYIFGLQDCINVTRWQGDKKEEAEYRKKLSEALRTHAARHAGRHAQVKAQLNKKEQRFQMLLKKKR